MSVVDVTFQSNDIQTATRIASAVVHESLPDKRIITQKLARGRNGEVITGIEYGGRKIIVAGSLVQTTQALLDADIDQLKADLDDQEGTLDLSFSGGTRRYIATCRGVKITKRMVNICEFEVEFYCADPFGRATSATNHSYDDKTDSPHTENLTYAGTAEVYPVWKVAFDAASSITAVTISNTTTGESMTITTAMTAGHYVQIDGGAMTVKKDTTAIDYTGTFPRLVPGVNAISITTTGTSRTIDIDVDYTQRFL